MDLVARIEVKVTQVCLSSSSVDNKNKGQQNMKAETVYTKISKSLHPSHFRRPSHHHLHLSKYYISCRMYYLQNKQAQINLEEYN